MKKIVRSFLAAALVVPGSATAQSAEPDAPPEQAPAAEPEAAAVEDESSWTDHLSYNVFADTFYQYDWNRPVNAAAMTNVPHRGYEYTNGFGLAFAGVDVAYTAPHVGATVSLRYGLGAQRYLIGGSVGYAGDPTDPSGTGSPTTGTGGNIAALAAVKQAFGSIMPTDSLTIDVGLFDTIYGAEVADSWVNSNYTRSPLNYLLQPFYH